MDTSPLLPPFDPELLTRVLAGTASPQERRTIDRWVAANTEHQRQFDRLVQGWAHAGTFPLDDRDRSGDNFSADVRMIEAVRARLFESEQVSEQPRRPHVLGRAERSAGASRWGWRAASIAVVTAFAVAVGWRVQTAPKGGKQVTAHQYTTNAGQYASVALGGGDSAKLGPATTLVVTGNAHIRTITVVGEASFTVDHDSKTPFVVRAGRTETRVLGTAFAVRKYVDERVAHVVVVSGRVAVGRRDGNAATVLSAGMQGVVDDSTGVATVMAADTNHALAWTNGDLWFTHTPARDVVADVGRAYGVTFTIADSTLAAMPLTWHIETRAVPFDVALSMLNDLLDAHVEMRQTHTGKVVDIIAGRSAGAKLFHRRSYTAEESSYGR